MKNVSYFRTGALLQLTMAVAFAGACATAPPPAPAAPTFEEKMSWILRLEDRRVLR